jgi:NADPH2:quinone reductase
VNAFRAFRIHSGETHEAGIEHLEVGDLSEGDVLIEVHYSSVNYKDALAGTGRGKILRRSPLIGGIDAAGRVVSSEDPRYAPGDAVVVTGCGMSEVRDGAYAEYLRVPGDIVVPLPGELDLAEAALIGTAGFTAALAIVRMEDNRQPLDLGPIAVTGATGGVGSFAVSMLSAKGYRVAAISGKLQEEAYLRALGATDVVDRRTLDLGDGSRPLERGMWGGAVDNVGGAMLAGLTRTVRPWGSIASIGLAGGHVLDATVMPFILRGVSLLGINAADCPAPLREEVWGRIAGDLRPAHLERIQAGEVTLEGLPEVFEAMLAGQTRGRYLVRVGAQAA